MPTTERPSPVQSFTQAFINFTDKCDKIFIPMGLHSSIAAYWTNVLGDAFIKCGLKNQYSAAFYQRIIASQVFDDAFTQKFLNKSADQAFRLIEIEMPFNFRMPCLGTPKRAHALGLKFFDLGTKILSDRNFLLKVLKVAMAALVASIAIKKFLPIKFGNKWEKLETELGKIFDIETTHCKVLAAHIMLAIIVNVFFNKVPRMPIYLDR